MPFYERGVVRIHYEEAGSGFPLLVIPGGGLNSTVEGLATHPFNPFDEFRNEYRVIAADLRNAKGGQSTGPLEIDRPWDAYTDDHIGLMDHLGIRQFMVLGFCIGGSSGTCSSEPAVTTSSRPCRRSPAATARKCQTSPITTT
jgi:pimeloyl-ACP methyl ester carboxylesterase